MKTIKTIAAAMVLAMFVGNANADVKLTQEVVNDYANRAEVLFTTDDIQCSIVAKMQTYGAADGGAVINLEMLGIQAGNALPDDDKIELSKDFIDFTERLDELKAVYKGAYIMSAHDNPDTNFYSLEDIRRFEDAKFDACLEDKESNPDIFKHYHAAGRIVEGRIAEGDF